MARCDDCKANKVCDHNRFGFENCGNFIPVDVAPKSEVIDEFVKRLKNCAYDQRYYDGTRIPIVEVHCIDRIAKEMKEYTEGE